MSTDAVQKLRALGHHIDIAPAEYDGYEAVARDPKIGVLQKATEFRKNGAVVGY